MYRGEFLKLVPLTVHWLFPSAGV